MRQMSDSSLHHSHTNVGGVFCFCSWHCGFKEVHSSCLTTLNLCVKFDEF